MKSGALLVRAVDTEQDRWTNIALFALGRIGRLAVLTTRVFRDFFFARPVVFRSIVLRIGGNANFALQRLHDRSVCSRSDGGKARKKGKTGKNAT